MIHLQPDDSKKYAEAHLNSHKGSYRRYRPIHSGYALAIGSKKPWSSAVTRLQIGGAQLNSSKMGVFSMIHGY